MSAGIILFAHGSSVESANRSVRETAAALARRGGFERVEAAFLELGSPGLGEAVDTMVRGGLRRIVIVPYFLTLGLHMQRDLPRLVAGIAARHPGVSVDVTAPLDGHPALIDALLDRARQPS